MSFALRKIIPVIPGRLLIWGNWNKAKMIKQKSKGSGFQFSRFRAVGIFVRRLKYLAFIEITKKRQSVLFLLSSFTIHCCIWIRLRDITELRSPTPSFVTKSGPTRNVLRPRLFIETALGDGLAKIFKCGVGTSGAVGVRGFPAYSLYVRNDAPTDTFCDRILRTSSARWKTS